ncbi:MAG: hypothetical protein U9R75_07805 [Candidatus Thermoplasmatota archaeon]|nr:hypothetical protein [Candidatus Thermoplasmatota archaeon]
MGFVEKDQKKLDEKMAVMLLEPSSKTTLAFIRSVDLLRASTNADDLNEPIRALHDDAMALHDVVLTLETDPEIVERNILARVISGVFPFLNSVEEFQSMEDQGLSDLILNSIGVISEIATSTQYLEATRILASAHFERNLVKVEERFVDIALSAGGDTRSKVRNIHSFMDELHKLDIPNREKAFLPFLLRTSVVSLSYQKVKNVMME